MHKHPELTQSLLEQYPPDGNVPSGESLVRQVLHSKNFFREEFGVEAKDLWLPDAFGYSAALPQILKKSGVDYFMTQKIGKNQLNPFPHHNFLWQGIEGTRIFSHFLPSDTPNGDMSPKELAQTIFRKAEAEAKDLPVWVGELSLELHRGTYTTQAWNKACNRKGEFLLRDAEFLAIISPDSGVNHYPTEALDRAWKTLLLNQFHATIPSSNILEIYRNSRQDYEEILTTATSLIEASRHSLAEVVNTRGMKRPVLVISNLSFFANEAVQVSGWSGGEVVAAVGPEGDIQPVQMVEQDGKRIPLFVAKNTPLHGYAVWDLAATSLPPEMDEPLTASPTHLENEVLRVEFDAKTGLITRIFDKDSEREVLNDTFEVDKKGNPIGPPHLQACANQFQLFEDKPLFGNVSDIDIFYQEKGQILTEGDSVEVVEAGPVRGAVRFVRSFGQSKITQTVRLTAGSARLDFVTEVDWQETEKMLKVAFPVAINSARATYEIQYGHVERPTHVNTIWDLARFEVCAHKWADLSEGDYGVALLNDSKYGYDIQGNGLRLTLLRAPQAPDLEADRGKHTFTYSLLPHGGDFREGEVVENAYALNAPPTARTLTGNRSGTLPIERSFFEVDNAAVFIEAIKRAEREAAIIVRLYEAHNTRGQVTLTTSLPVRKAWLTDLMETNLVELPLANGEVTLPIHPFEIVTVKFVL